MAIWSLQQYRTTVSPSDAGVWVGGGRHEKKKRGTSVPLRAITDFWKGGADLRHNPQLKPYTWYLVAQISKA